MIPRKPATSFATEVEEIPLEAYDQTEDEVDGPRREGLQRSSTDAHLSEYRPQHRVRFHTLASGMEKRLSSEGISLLSSKAHQIGHANWAGGWQNTVFRRRRTGLTPRSEEEEVQEIAQAMEEDQKLMADDVDGEVLRRDALRELTKSLRFKKEIKQRIKVSRTSIRSSGRNISYWKSFKYSISMKLYLFQERIKMAMRDFALWQTNLKVIEGLFGSSVGSYFRFLRYLFVVNVLAGFLIIGFLFIPQLFFSENSKEEYHEEFTTEATSLGDSYALNLEADAYTQSLEPSIYDNSSSFGALDWLTGAGWFGTTLLYYGGYSSGVMIALNSKLSYDMSQAYFLTVTTCFGFYLCILLYKIHSMYSENYVDSEENICVTYAEKIFAAWDFNITHEKSSSIKRKSIYNDLMELLQEYQEEEVVEGFFRHIAKKIFQILVWFVLVSFLALLGWGLYLLLKDQLHDLTQQEGSYWTNSLELLVYPSIVTILMVGIPILFENFGHMEKYSKPRWELYVNLIRVFLLEVVILVALFVFWYENSPGLKEELKPLRQTFLESQLEQEQDDDDPPNYNTTSVQCWENGLGEEIYRLVIVDFFVILVSTLCVDRLKKYIVERGRANDSLLQFCISRNTLHIIYNQTLLWAGLFFCPLLPLIISLKFLLIFYLQKFSVTMNLQPTDRPWKASQTQTLFFALTLISLILAASSYGFIIVRGYSSQNCGPFQDFSHYIDILWSSSDVNSIFLLNVIAFFIKPEVILFFILILSLCVYCIKNISEGRAQLVCVLRRQLKLEMKDRIFLQRLIEKVNRGEPLHSESPARSNTEGPFHFPNSNEEREPKHLTKRSSFVFSRNSSVASDQEASSRL